MMNNSNYFLSFNQTADEFSPAQSLATVPNFSLLKFLIFFLTLSPQGIGQTAWITPDTAVVRTPGVWLLRVIPEKEITPGTRILVEFPQWWEIPQVSDSSRSGYVTVRCSRHSVKLRSDIFSVERFPHSVYSVRIEIQEDAVGQHDTLFVYLGHNGERAVGILPNWFAGAQKFRVTGLPSTTTIEIPISVLPGSGKTVRLVAQNRARGSLQLRLAVTDEYGNKVTRWTEQFEVLKNGIPFAYASPIEGAVTIPIEIQDTGFVRFATRDRSGKMWISNPVSNLRSGRWQVRWGDVHTHTMYSRHGWGLPSELFEYAKTVVGLDWVCYSEHDYMDGSKWNEIIQDVEAHNSSDFVTILGTEYTPPSSDPAGHLNIFYSGTADNMIRYSGISFLPKMLRYLEKIRAFAQANHPYLKDFKFTEWKRFRPDVLRLVEIVNGLETYEFPLDPSGDGLYHRLKDGWIFGFTGSSDNHFAQPGKYWTTDQQSGITAVLVTTLTRESVLEALRSGRTYATNGIRPYIEFTVNGHPVGSIIRNPKGSGKSKVEIFLRVESSREIDTVRIMKKAGPVFVQSPKSNSLNLTLSDSLNGENEFYYVYIYEAGGGKAWTSPIFFRYYDPNFRLTEPLSGDSLLAHPTKPIRFSWRKAFADEPSGPNEYGLFIQGANLDTLIEVFDDTTANVSILGRLIPSSIYSWWVSGRNGKGDAWVSDTAYFRTAGLAADSHIVALIYPSSFALFSNYPNPFNSTTEIKYAVAKRATVTLTIFDITGKTIESPLHSLHEPGFYSFTWTANSLSSGIYFCRMEADTHDGATAFRSTAKMVLIR